MINEYIKSNRNEKSFRYGIYDPVPRITCADGFSMSVQAGEYLYCHPRDNTSVWTAVEVGYPSEAVPEFMPYIDGVEENPTDTVYGYVPVEIVEAVILKHGGIRSNG